MILRRCLLVIIVILGQGSLFGGEPAARVTDMHLCPSITGIIPHIGGPVLPIQAPTVLIGHVTIERAIREYRVTVLVVHPGAA